MGLYVTVRLQISNRISLGGKNWGPLNAQVVNSIVSASSWFNEDAIHYYLKSRCALASEKRHINVLPVDAIVLNLEEPPAYLMFSRDFHKTVDIESYDIWVLP